MTEKPRPGRPPASVDGQRRRSRKVTFSDGEWAWIKDRAARLKVSAAEWIRRKVLRGYGPPS